MKKTIKITSLLILAAVCAFAQLATTNTTLSVAVASNTTTQWCVASATGISVGSLASNATSTYLFVDKEAAQVTSAGSSATCFNVKRGLLGTSANYSHSTSSKVWVGNVATGTGDNSHPFSGGPFIAVIPSGTCTATAQYTLPVIVTGTPGGASMSTAGETYTCSAGYWTRGTPQTSAVSYSAFYTLPIQPPTTAAYGSVTHVAGKTFFSQLFIPANATLTGACWFNGATITTDNTIAILWDNTGAVLAQTADTVDSGGTASVYMCAAFTSTVAVYGPGSYFIGIETKGTTDNFYTYTTGGAPTGYATGSKTGTYLTVTAITPTTSFTTAVGPVMIVY